MKTQVISFDYIREQVKTGIMHIGVGNFHRAHEEFYTNRLLADTTQQNWGICGVMLLPGDERLYKALKKQDNIYTLTVCGRDGKDEVYCIGSLVELIWGVENPKAVIDKIADKDIKIITMTITEGGYNIDKTSGEFMLGENNVKHDITNPRTPKTVFGFIAEGLRRRKEAGNGPITLLSCDNLQHNGNTAKKAFTTFITAQDKELAEWVEQNVTFPNSMVDRITPATRPEDVILLNEKNGTQDEAPVYSEDFIQWVIEDNFIAGRPAWEKVGVTFTHDVTPYEIMKLSLLNASHTLLSYPAYMEGFRKVDAVMADERYRAMIKLFMNRDVTPYVPVPEGVDLEAYKDQLIERFSNKAISDQVSRLCGDGIAKFAVYVVPILKQMLQDGKDISIEAFLIAVYCKYLIGARTESGENIAISEPHITPADRKLISGGSPAEFLKISPFVSLGLDKYPVFMEKYEQFYAMQVAEGLKVLLQ